MKILTVVIVGFVVFVAIIWLTKTWSTANKSKPFINSEKAYHAGLSSLWPIAKAYWNTQRQAPAPHNAVPLEALTQTILAQSTEDAVYRLGHSTLLMRIDGEYVLIDPVFSERASPVQWAGPKRFHQSPISIADLPAIKAVIISHDHYDHLDKAAIEKLVGKVQHFVTPLKVGEHLTAWGVDPIQITELEWWQSVELEGLRITATPAQHFSGRGLFDRDHTLWASWVIQGLQHKVFFSGDSGYFNGFKEIGQRLGPFDLSMIETGAYNDLWSDIHMLPEQSLQAHIDVNAKAMIPVHNGTFDLALHDWFEPFERINKLAKQHNVTLLTPKFGQAVMLANPQANELWWRDIMINPTMDDTEQQIHSNKMDDLNEVVTNHH
ncbi:MBL fold metallo-hydrolase [Shewanella ulleungensis]|uniref:Hydrolase n=1 Tax=Shewanella ulleungensis TaxID=2282699 RepID=A0ABQ2QTS4_9GAMM|nr:MBL fold metallo-hydrolase [Shewanella ulleungensis]MCL1151260.1 MBL fold metallo-hydrolase [Shewanella ulleungensis]GGP96694.1 hydrolase [Shewanella ulleungensis]